MGREDASNTNFSRAGNSGPPCSSLIRVVNSAGAVRLIAVVPSFLSRPVERHHWSKMERSVGKDLSVQFFHAAQERQLRGKLDSFFSENYFFLSVR